MKTLPEFHPGRTAREAHMALEKSVKIADQAQHCAVLWFAEILKRKLFRELGFSSMNQYAAQKLSFSRSRTGDFMMLAKRLDELPAVKAEMAAGRLGYTLAREIVPVADASNEKAWLEVAQNQSRRELAETVKQAKAEAKRKPHPSQAELIPAPPATTPPAVIKTRIGFELTPVQLARFEALQAQIGHQANRAEWLLDMMEQSLVNTEPNTEPNTEQKSPRGDIRAPYQIHVHECPTCQKSAVQTRHGEQELAANEKEVTICDAQVQSQGHPNKSTIPPRIRREVLSRDRHRCRRKGCEHTGYLHIHHMQPRSRGGSNKRENLVTLCSACHHLWHEQGGDLGDLLTEVQT